MSKSKKDLTGMKFGNLNVIDLFGKEDGKYYWNTICDCGNYKKVWTSNLTREKVTSCGCLINKPNLIGLRFGYGVVIDKASLRKENNRQEWVLKCDCGNIYQAKTCQLTGPKNRRSISCKCKQYDPMNKEKMREPNIIGHKNLTSSIWNIYKTNSRKKKIEFNITSEYAYNVYILQNKKCVYTGWNIDFGKIIIIDGRKTIIDKTASMDRINNKKGYIEGNIQWVNKHVNLMKNSHSEEYFLEICKAVTNNRTEVEQYE